MSFSPFSHMSACVEPLPYSVPIVLHHDSVYSLAKKWGQITSLTLDPWDVGPTLSIRTAKESNIVLTATLIALNMRCSKQARGFRRLINSDRLRCAHRCVRNQVFPQMSAWNCRYLAANWCAHYIHYTSDQAVGDEVAWLIRFLTELAVA